MAHNTFFTPFQNRTLFAFLAISTVVKLVAAVVFAIAAVFAPEQNLEFAVLAAAFGAGFAWMARYLRPTFKLLFG